VDKPVTPAIIACARAAHEANRAYCLATGDGSQFTWDTAPGWQKDSAIKGVFGVLAGNGPEESHASWLREKEAAGWVYGDIKMPDAKPPQHPCMVPYDRLPPEQRMKDHVFVSVVTAMAKALRLIIEIKE
jgi:hypothetical protein